MNIYISNLCPEIQELCFLRQREQGNLEKFTGELSYSKSDRNFDWHRTPEELLWMSLNNEEITQEEFLEKFYKTRGELHYEIY